MLKADRMKVLTEAECRKLLSDHQHGVGRVGFDDGLPTILPVNYVLDADRVVFRTAAGSKLDAAVENKLVAFQIDSISASSHAEHGWSVLVRGRASIVTDANETAFLNLSRLEPDAGGLKGYFITIDIGQVTGRRF